MNDEYTSKLGDYFRSKGAEVAFLFGSRADGRHQPESDYDIAVLWPEPFDPLEAIPASKYKVLYGFDFTSPPYPPTLIPRISLFSKADKAASRSLLSFSASIASRAATAPPF